MEKTVVKWCVEIKLDFSVVTRWSDEHSSHSNENVPIVW
jgi:hypothetical protein